MSSSSENVTIDSFASDSFASQRILLVEDNEDDYLIVRDLLADIQGRHVQLDWVTNVEDALANFSTHSYDACLLDYKLGGQTGLEFLQGLPPDNPVPIILLTGMEDHRVDVEVARAGASDYLVKSELTSPVLERSIRYAMHRKQSETALREAQLFAQATVDALPDGIAVLDAAGTIVAVNAAWRDFEAHRGGRAAGPGTNYLAACENGQVPDGRLAADGLRRVLSGEAPELRLEYQLVETLDTRWFEMRAAPFGAPGKETSSVTSHIVVAHADITARKKAEGRLRDSEASLAHAQQISHLGSWELDLGELQDVNANPLRWSDEVFRIFGYEPGAIEVSNEAFFGAVHRDDRARIEAAIRGTIQHGTPYSLEHRIVLPDGSERIVHEQSELVLDESTGRPLRMLGTVQDVTAQRRADESLRHTNALLRAVTEGTTDAIFAKNISGRYVMMNSACARYFGGSADDLTGLNDVELIEEQPAQVFLDSDRSVLASGQFETHEETLDLPGHGLRTFLTTKGPLRGPDGNIAGIVGIARDITERKRDEEALRASEERFQSIVANVPGMVWQLVLKEGAPPEWKYISEGSRELYGVEPAEFEKDSLLPLRSVHPDDKQSLRDSLALSAHTRSPWHWEGRHKMPSGQTRWIQSVARPQSLPGGGTLWNGLVTDITALREAEEQRDRFFTMSLDMLCITGLDGRFKRTNPALIKGLGYSKAELLGRPFLDFVHPDDRTSTRGALEALEEGKPVSGFENRYRRKDGEWRWLEWHSISSPETGLIYAAARDVTERKEMEAALLRLRDDLELRVAERTAELAATNAQLQVQVSERESAEAEIRTRARQQEAVAELGRSALSDTDIDTLLTNATTLVAATLDVELSSVLELSPGAQTLTVRAATGWPAEVAGMELPVAHQSQAGYCLLSRSPAIVPDMRTETRFQPSRVFLDEGIVSGVIVAIGSYDEPYGTLGAHTRHLRDFTLDDVHFLQSMANVLGAALEQRNGETEIRALNGRLEATNEQLRSQIVDRQAALAALSDLMTVLKQAKEEADVAREHAEVANRAKSEFLSRMSHELRTPLNSILGFGQLMAMTVDEKDTQHRESIEWILKAGRHLLDLINEVLDIARIEAGHLSLTPEPAPVSVLIGETLDLVRPLAGQRSIQLTYDPAATRAHQVLADQQRLKQVLLNLLSNAVKYNADAGRVTVASLPRAGAPVYYDGVLCAGRLRIEVRDTGKGLTPEEISRLFVPFERLGAERTNIEGTGIGLALCKRLVESMRGEIGVESEVGQGSTFWLELPMVQPAEVGENSTAPDGTGAIEPVLESPVLEGQRTVLYIEDNVANIELMQRVITGYSERIRLLPAMQGSLGVDLAAQHRPDLILLDVNLPDIGGEMALERLKANPSTSAIPVVVLSADATTHQIERMMTAGAMHYLTKPIDLPELFGVLSQTLDTDPEKAAAEAAGP